MCSQGKWGEMPRCGDNVKEMQGLPMLGGEGGNIPVYYMERLPCMHN